MSAERVLTNSLLILSMANSQTELNSLATQKALAKEPQGITALLPEGYQSVPYDHCPNTKVVDCYITPTEAPSQFSINFDRPLSEAEKSAFANFIYGKEGLSLDGWETKFDGDENSDYIIPIGKNGDRTDVLFAISGKPEINVSSTIEYLEKTFPDTQISPEETPVTPEVPIPPKSHNKTYGMLVFLGLGVVGAVAGLSALIKHSVSETRKADKKYAKEHPIPGSDWDNSVPPFLQEDVAPPSPPPTEQQPASRSAALSEDTKKWLRQKDEEIKQKRRR